MIISPPVEFVGEYGVVIFVDATNSVAVSTTTSDEHVTGRAEM